MKLFLPHPHAQEAIDICSVVHTKIAKSQGLGVVAVECRKNVHI